MAQYVVTIHRNKKYTMVADSLAQAKRIAVNFIMEQNGRFAFAQIYTKSAWDKGQSYSYDVGPVGQYSRARDNALHGYNFVCRAVGGKGVTTYIKPDGTPSKYSNTGFKFHYGWGWEADYYKQKR